ncbi:transcription factor lim1 [Pelomyxa schiedti]|nr:transcription factor lim1 [Pelomyxa schiedti]
MPSAKCAICSKTAYPLESFNAIEKTYHKDCFKCETCKLKLNLTNFKGLDGKIYCALHVPKAKATQVTDSVAIKNATNAPRRTAESLGTVQKGTGGKPQIQTFGAVEGGTGEGAPADAPADGSEGAPADAPVDTPTDAPVDEPAPEGDGATGY